MSNDKQPEIRFPGFTEDWEQRKLGEVVERVTRKNKKLESIRPLTISAQEGLIDQNEFFNKTVASRDVSGYYLVKKGEFAYNKSYSNGYPWGAVKRLNQYDMGVLSTLYIVFKPKKIDSDFLEKYYDTTYWYKEVSKHAAEGARNHGLLNIAASDFFETEIVMPLKIEEQQKIGAFFKQLDDTIALHQRKLDLLKETKKGFLQKMFPKNGAKVPEIRFPGFTEDWEERRLQEVVDRYDNLRIPITASKRVAGNTPYYGANGIQGYVEGYTHDGEFILVAEDGANDLKNYPVQYVDGKVWVNNHAHVIQAKENLADNMFLMNAIRSINIEPFLVGGGRAKLNADVLMKLEVIIPLKSEQQKIGNFFKQLDDTITLHQRKLDLLKEMKKGFLQKMFV
ncbi:TPA: restriction endonuclease subunit S [Enterococcus hirae]